MPNVCFYYQKCNTVVKVSVIEMLYIQPIVNVEGQCYL